LTSMKRRTKYGCERISGAAQVRISWVAGMARVNVNRQIEKEKGKTETEHSAPVF